MAILKKVKSLIGEIVQRITMEYFISWAAPGNVEMQVGTLRKSEAEREKDDPINFE